MSHDALRTAGSYLNNLLLARGLLRDGQPIDFVKPSKESRASIINLVHDLILREDRDKEQQEHIAATMRQLKAEDARKTHEIERLTAKSDESARAAAQAQAAERAAQAEVKKVEKAIKSLQDQATKLKATLAQVKTQCTNDVRKRDLELARLKTHLQGQQRGSRAGMTAPSMTVRKSFAEPARDVGDPEYTLKQETTEFLTQLSQNLSDENDSLIALIRNALSTLRPLLGLPLNARRHPDSAVGSMGSEEEHGGKQTGCSNMLHTLPTSYEALEADMQSTLVHLKTLLTNPNFVPMDEVEVREEEIARLRDGWEHMEDRWKDVMLMMGHWLRRMNTGETINIDDLREGMRLASPDRPRSRDQKQSVENSLMESESSEIRLPNVDGPSIVTLSSTRPSMQNRGSPKRKRDVLEPPEFFDLRPPTASSKTAPTSPKRKPDESTPLLSNGPGSAIAMLPEDEDQSEELEVPQMTIAEKLSAAQKEAEEAAAADEEEQAAAAREENSGPKASRRAQVPAYSGLGGSLDELANERDDDTLGKMPSPMGKRTKIRGRPRKRKSTLSPEELETLLVADEE
ncbi:Hypothetical predicted protein [Lecanosticta acicola]|uniref:NIMA interactive protein n=1 Tax=Lecanosticta acicola TaxID=111012 RepID=A0AAI8YP98_9PEZI|nr:Hypothetical predicted protein [Lecanosticta acicola]